MSDIRGKTECPCCKEKLKPCPFCGKPAEIYGENLVGCSGINSCDAQMDTPDAFCTGNIDFGHWCGTENGIPAVHHVIKAWNKRTPK